jgi:solute carrier family 50 protein (sugar transporter)
MAITDVLGAMGNIIAILCFIIPITMMIELYKSKDTSKIPYLLFIFTILNCEFWAIYGLKINAWPIWLCNSLGIVTNCFFLTMFFIYLNITNNTKIVYISTLYVSFVLSFGITYIFVDNYKLIGFIAMIMNILMYAAPLQKLLEVINKKDSSYIPIWVTLTFAISSCIWISYGYFKERDLYIIIPNSIGLTICLIQIILFFVFRKQKIDKANSDEIDLKENKEYEKV